MNLQLFATLKNYNFKNLPRDIFSGIIIAAVSIPISMGYAQISGIPAIYGLYGSVFPILFFALFSTSKQFIFGVDAAPAAIVGSALSTLGIAVESPDAMKYVPMIALFAGSVASCCFIFCMLTVLWILFPHQSWAGSSVVSRLRSFLCRFPNLWEVLPVPARSWNCLYIFFTLSEL